MIMFFNNSTFIIIIIINNYNLAKVIVKITIMIKMNLIFKNYNNLRLDENKKFHNKTSKSIENNHYNNSNQ